MCDDDPWAANWQRMVLKAVADESFYDRAGSGIQRCADELKAREQRKSPAAQGEPGNPITTVTNGVSLPLAGDSDAKVQQLAPHRRLRVWAATTIDPCLEGGDISGSVSGGFNANRHVNSITNS